MSNWLVSIAMIRRDLPRNALVMALCDEMERRILIEKTAQKKRGARKKFDKTAYQREYMRQRRAIQKELT